MPTTQCMHVCMYVYAHVHTQVNSILSPVFFASYMIFSTWILLNMFLAILNDAFVSLKADDKEEARTHTCIHPRIRTHARTHGCVHTGQEA